MPTASKTTETTMSKTDERATVRRVSGATQESAYSVDVPPDHAYWGPPGTGKTTTLMEVLADEIDSGVDPESIAGLTYRKNMAEEFREKAAEVVGRSVEDGWYRTTHSACYRLLDLSKDDVVDSDALRDFCEAHGYGWGGGVADADTDDNSPWLEQHNADATNQGEVLASIRSWCINMGLDPRRDWRMAEIPGDELEEAEVSDRVVTEFNNEYESWKENEGMYDFDDMLLEVIDAGIAPPVEVLIEDEFQDKTPIQIELYNVWADQIETVYVAGDPFQSIYMFMGTDPRFMADAYEMADESRILDTSYRLGPEVVDRAKSILSFGGHEQPRIDPTGDTTVEEIWWGDYPHTVAENADTDSGHLIRANFMAKHVGGALGDAGVPFQSKTTRWTDKQVDIYNAVAKAQRSIENTPALTRPEFDLSDGEMKRLVSVLPGGAFQGNKSDAPEAVESGASLLDIVNLSALTDCILGNPFTGISGRGSDSLVASSVGSQAVRDRMASTFDSRDGKPIEAINHAITTIHGAKGQEYDNVYLIDATTSKIQKETDPYMESLVWYVGATRAIDTLYIVRNSPASSYSTRYL
jgi:superfamily I DNA/RNA helicase